MVDHTLNPAVTFLPFDSRQQASSTLANEIASTLQESLKHKTTANLVVSGGTSPVAFFHSLRDQDLEWERVAVIPSDERCVPADHADRNDAMIQREFIQAGASKALLRGLLPRNDSDSSSILKSMPSMFDAVVLGMGEDGHTASLFPDSPTLERALSSTELTVTVSVPRLKAERISLTPAALLTSQRIDLLFFGETKRQVFEQALQPGPVSTYPVRAVLHQDRVPVRVFWAP
jgi:6-phosphogluconolactonase